MAEAGSTAEQKEAAKKQFEQQHDEINRCALAYVGPRHNVSCKLLAGCATTRTAAVRARALLLSTRADYRFAEPVAACCMFMIRSIESAAVGMRKR